MAKSTAKYDLTPLISVDNGIVFVNAIKFFQDLPELGAVIRRYLDPLGRNVILFDLLSMKHICFSCGNIYNGRIFRVCKVCLESRICDSCMNSNLPKKCVICIELQRALKKMKKGVQRTTLSLPFPPERFRKWRKVENMTILDELSDHE